MNCLRLLTCIIAVGALVGCAGPRPTMPAPYTIVISATPDINPDRQNRATPVQVRLFELKNSTNFENIDFYTLFDKGDQALGADVLSKEQLTMQPGQTVTLARKVPMDARMLGVFVPFKDIEKSTWRAVAPLPQPKEIGRFAIFQPSFETAIVTIKISAHAVTAKTTGTDVPVPIPGAGGLPKVNVPRIPATLPAAPLRTSAPTFFAPGGK